MMNIKPTLANVFALLFGIIFFASCGDKCADTCINGDCVSVTASQKECVCNDGYIGDNCETALNSFLDFTEPSSVYCGSIQGGDLTFIPRTNPLTVTIEGLGDNSIVAELAENTSTFQAEPYNVNTVTIQKTALSSSEQIQGSGEFSRVGDYIVIDFEVLDNQDNLLRSCNVTVFY